MQTIEAINHLKNKMSVGKNKMSLTDYDRKCLNIIIDNFNQSNKVVSDSQRLFKKLFINEFLRNAVLYHHGTKSALESLEDRLKIPLSEYYKAFSEESKFYKYQERLIELEYVAPEDLSRDPMQRHVQQEKNRQILETNYDDLKSILFGEQSMDVEEAEKWLENHMYEVIINYRKYD